MYKPGVCRSARRSPRQALWVLVEALVPPSPPLPPHLHREVTILNISPYFEVTIMNLSPYPATCSKSHQLARSSFGPQYACPAICLVYTLPIYTMSSNCKGALYSPTTCIFINCSKNESSGRESLSVVATDNRCRISGCGRKTSDENPVYKEE